MTGRVCIVTGANSTIGKEIARELAGLHATVFLACRSVERGERARAEIAQETGAVPLAVMELDLARLESVRAFAAAFTATHDRLHLLVNNAGIYTAKRALTGDGVESTFASNHLGHFLLTNLVLETLRAGAPSRIINVSSEASQMGTIHLDDPNLSKNWSGMAAYCQSKLANLLFTAELARRLEGSGVAAYSMHPGAVRSGWGRRSGGFMSIGVRLAAPFLISPAKGADTAVWLASAADVGAPPGTYFYKRRPLAPNPIARDATSARRLWDLSEAWTALHAPVGIPS